MNCSTFRYSRHAIERMVERAIPPDVVVQVVTQGEVIATYPDDQPFPSELILGYDRSRPIHVVASRNAETRECHVITVYVPNVALWDEGFKRRRKS